MVREPPARKLDIVRAADGGRELVAARWSLIPSWAKEASIGNKMIIARAETVAGKPALRAAFHSRRCIVPAWGFYDWRRHGGGPKQPFLVRRKDGQRPCPDGWLEAVPVSTRVNSPRNDAATLIQPEGEPLGPQGTLR